MPIIEVSHITKEYRLGAMQGIKQTLLNSIAKFTGKVVEERPLFKALDDVSFSIEQGEVVGIIGHNGAGKSTLLKMLANISRPSHGQVKVHGRIAPLIEVGAGFIPEFTGRENVYLNGSILGMTKQEIDNKFDEIVDFAEMAEFIDTPVKRYSSGMQVKLAFSVATSIDAEILIVDEVLAVGDLAFQRKCFDRMEDKIKRQGLTVLVVSHNIRQIQRLCNRVVLMDHGRMLKDDTPEKSCNLFYELSDKQIAQNKQHAKSKKVDSSGDVDVEQIEILDPVSGQALEQVAHGSDVTFRIHLRVSTPQRNARLALGIHTTDFIYLCATSYALPDEAAPGKTVLDCTIRNFPLLPRTYGLRIGINAGESNVMVFYGEGLLNFLVTKKDINRTQTSENFIPLNAEWQSVMSTNQ
ncbi:MAG: ABC transporter ATP-binding protein [Pseudomonadales bacterium]|nr:ABC transporter ATP-binding protein [Pseudomonadales bacterium]